MNNVDSFVSRLVTGVVATLVSVNAYAQAPAEPAPAPAVPPAAVPPTAPPPDAAPPVAAPPPAPPPAEPLPPPAATEPPAMPATPPVPETVAEKKEEDEFKITTGAGLRAALRFQNQDAPDELGDQQIDELNLELRFSGKVTKVVAWTGNLTISGRTPDSVVGVNAAGDTVPTPGPIKFQAQALDFIGQLDFVDEFHIWLGRMLTPSDRSNFSGPWFMSPWNYPGSYFVGGGPYIGPRGTEEVGREVGATVWGNDKSGKFKYYASVLDLDNPELSPLLSGRLGFAIIGDEPGFYGSSTYYGSKDILALGVAAQYQKESTTAEPDNDLTEINADLLAEFTVPNAGTFSGEAAYYHFDGPSAVFPVDDAYFVLASYLTPEPIGLGKIQILGRLQQTMDPDYTMYDVVASYVMKDYFAKISLGYTHVDLGGDVNPNMLQLGLQIQQ